MEKNTIICVDDEAIILMSLKEELRSNLGNRFLYESALNARDALQLIGELVNEGATEIMVISDWLMPGMKGDEFLAIVREKYPFIKTILITGQADDTAIERVMKEGIASAVLRKPWSTSQLLQAIEGC